MSRGFIRLSSLIAKHKKEKNSVACACWQGEWAGLKLCRLAPTISLCLFSCLPTTVLCYMDGLCQVDLLSLLPAAIINASTVMVRGKHNSMGIKLTFTKCKSFALTRKILSEQSLFSLKPTPLSWVLLSIICINAVWFVPSQALPITRRSRP